MDADTLSDDLSMPRNRKGAPLADSIADELRRRIAGGDYAPNTFLPAERLLVEELGASRRTVGGALRALEREGLVERTPGRGTRVLSPLERFTHDRVAICYPHSGQGSESHSAERDLILRGIEEALTRLEYPYEIVPSYRLHDSAGAMQERFGAYLFIEIAGQERVVQEIERRHGLYVVVNMEWDQDVTATAVDHAAVTRQALDLLVGMGHRRIAYLGSDPDVFFYGHMLQAYCDGMADAGLPVQDAWIDVARKTNPLQAYLAAKPMLALAERPTAIIAARDRLAEGVCQAALEAGLHLGHDLSVIGYDDCTWSHEERYLTTFHEPCREMGQAAVEMLAHRLVHGWQPPVRRIVEAPLVMRKTVGPPPQSASPSPSF